MTNEEIQNIFTYHAPVGTQTSRYEGLRHQAQQLAMTIQVFCPDGREKSLALTNVQQAVMWANAAIAINEVKPTGGIPHDQTSQ